MLETVIINESWDVASRLEAFGVDREELLDVVRAVVAYRANAVPNDPKTAEGQFAYIYGTRYTRQVFQRAGYENGWENGVEYVGHPESGVKVIYQSVDQACEITRSPQAISGKGSGAAAVVNSAQPSLFVDGELPETLPPNMKATNGSVWYFCVSVAEGKVSAELSQPARIVGRNFEHFIERIFILKPDEWDGLDLLDDMPDEESVDIDPIVSRK